MITVIGNFGDEENMYCGQVQRTINIYKALEKKIQKRVLKINTQTHSIWNYIKMGIMIVFSSKIIILPGEKSLDKILRVLRQVGRLNRTHYVVIGGWLPSYLDDNKQVIEYLKRLKSIHVQTESMVDALRQRSINNVFWLPNFRIYSGDSYITKEYLKKEKFRFVYYARVTETKGIKILLDAFEKVQRSISDDIELRIYGPVDNSVEPDFDNRVSGNNSIIYGGILARDVLETLSINDTLVFPTHYEGEGFPGTILESILSGLPIIASDWKYNKELINKYQVGVLFDPFSLDELVEKMIKMIKNTDELRFFHDNCKKAAKELNSNTIIDEFVKIIFK